MEKQDISVKALCMTELKLHEMVTNRTQKYLSQMELCRQKPGEEAIHDVRVAARRLSAALRFCEGYLPAKRVAKVQVKLAGLLKMLNPLRDAQVMAASIADTAHPLHSDMQFAAWLRRQASEQEQIAEVAFGKAKPPGPSPKSLAALFAKASKKTRRSDPLRSLKMADAAFAKCLRRQEQIDPANPDTIHSYRVAFKKFRYTTELATQVLPENEGIPTTVFKAMHDHQQLLGQIQDLDVLQTTYRRFLAHEQRPNPAGCQAMAAQMDALIADLMEQMTWLITFWRISTSKPYPWQSCAVRDTHPDASHPL